MLTNEIKKGTLYKIILIITILGVSKTESKSKIKDFEIQYFKAKRKSLGIHELDIGIPKNESMWLAATGDLDGDKR